MAYKENDIKNINFAQWMDLSEVGYNKDNQTYIYQNKEYDYSDLLELFNKKLTKFGK